MFFRRDKNVEEGGNKEQKSAYRIINQPSFFYNLTSFKDL